MLFCCFWLAADFYSLKQTIACEFAQLNLIIESPIMTSLRSVNPN